MPIWLRKFTFKKIEEFYEKEREEYDKQQNSVTNNTKKEIVPGPNIRKAPDYKSKAVKN